jgi:GNAT superfamily N-acetyltransferase
MRIRTGEVSGSDEQRLLTEYFEYRLAAFPPADGDYVVALPSASVFLPPHGVFLVVEGDDGVAVGCGGIRLLPGANAADEPAVRYEVKHVWLEPRMRGGGHATALMNELEQRARDLGATELVLDTHHSLEAAGRLYARLRYEPIAPYNDNPNATRWYRKRL